MNKLYRISNCYRVLYLNGDYELDNIIFFNENGKILEVGCGYFENDEELEFGGNVIKKNKEDFKIKNNYIISAKNDWSSEKRYDLYIYTGNVKIENLGVVKEYNNIYNMMSVNGIKVRQYIRNLEQDKYIYIQKIEQQTEQLKSYQLPKEEKELNKILNEIRKYNKKILEIEEYAKNYEPKTLEEELKLANKESK